MQMGEYLKNGNKCFRNAKIAKGKEAERTRTLFSLKRKIKGRPEGASSGPAKIAGKRSENPKTKSFFCEEPQYGGWSRKTGGKTKNKPFNKARLKKRERAADSQTAAVKKGKTKESRAELPKPYLKEEVGSSLSEAD